MIRCPELLATEQYEKLARAFCRSRSTTLTLGEFMCENNYWTSEVSEEFTISVTEFIEDNKELIEVEVLVLD